MPDELKPLFVRLPAQESDGLSELARTTGRSKRHLVGEAVRDHLRESGALTVGRAALREPLPEVLTLAEAAGLLRVDESTLAEAAAGGAIPGRCLGGQWRFSGAALMDWLASAARPAVEAS